ncbi:ATP-binding cassette domain-containing protein [Spirillospora sp. NPDC029432]|uniref:ATP-binding cassette domain-containing protein n=1 Tax=Spirillospora sp. NPDC029432 TaxID=3154599 RepID=UPI0034536C0E
MIADHSAIVARGMGVRRGGRWLLRPVAFGIAEGVVGLAGPPGVGKSTLLATFATLRRPHSGRLDILGHDTGDTRGRRAVRARIGYLPGRFRWSRNMTAEELVAYSAYYKRVRAPAARDVMKRFGIADDSRTELALLPPDVRLRAGLAAACVHEPELVVLDDPLEELYAGRGAADEAAIAELIPLIGALAPTVVVSAARPERLAPWCRHVLTLARGRLTQYEPRPTAPATVPTMPTVAGGTAHVLAATGAPPHRDGAPAGAPAGARGRPDRAGPPMFPAFRAALPFRPPRLGAGRPAGSGAGV